MITTSINYLKELITPSGLFRASTQYTTGYNRIWIRDNLYISIGFESNKPTIEKVYHSLLDLMIKYEWKIDEVIKEKPTEDFKFIHPLYTDALEEIEGGWGWKQNDAIGGLLFHVGDLQQKGYNILYKDPYYKIIGKLVQYLKSIRYWEDEDNGMWEENKEIHSSSVGACVAGLEKIKYFTNVPKNLIQKGRNTLKQQLPKESIIKKTDLSLLSLIYPYDIINTEMSLQILNDVEKYLVKKNGVIRYKDDKYYCENEKEASWTMGFPWLAICYYQLNNLEKYKCYLQKSINSLTNDLKMPELYKEDKEPNENTPLGWSQSLLIKAITL